LKAAVFTITNVTHCDANEGAKQITPAQLQQQSRHIPQKEKKIGKLLTGTRKWLGKDSKKKVNMTNNAVHDNISQFNACNNLNGGFITSILMDIHLSDKKTQLIYLPS
jgi:hypothetical protein